MILVSHKLHSWLVVCWFIAVYIILTVLCTCNEACSVRVVDNIEPTHLIIDEAAMATEPEAMIPIQLADHVTLIGDHMQLQVCVLPNIVSLL